MWALGWQDEYKCMNGSGLGGCMYVCMDGWMDGLMRAPLRVRMRRREDG